MKKCELLVPAGGKKQFVAAVENGADAIYVGGKLFNARINAGNFDDEEMEKAVAFAHKRGVKVYVTMNTLVKDEEMEEAVRYAALLYRFGVDALIVQDVGLGKVIKENMPDFQLHFSTQGSVYDLEGVKAAMALGYDRVVLARELSFEEIREICQGTETEIEVFVHGAMCICYSGQCQMSRYYGGRSGNRGECAQPCRLPYKSFDEKGKLINTFKYPLSPKDICYIDHLGKLAEMGVSSLKIEGRMKSAEYVAVVTGIYRKYLDLYFRDGNYTVSSEDRAALEQIFNRGGFTEGYFFDNPRLELMSGNIPKHRGVKIGKVIGKVQGTCLVDVKLYKPLAIGDGVEVQGKNITGNVVTYYKELKSGLTRIGDIKGYVAHGDILYKITSKEQLESARKTFEKRTYDEGKFIRKRPVDIKCSMNDGILKLNLKCDLISDDIMVEAGPFDRAKNEPTKKESIEASLKKTGNIPYEVRKVEFLGTFDRKVAKSSINDTRRKIFKILDKKLSKKRNTVFPAVFYVPDKKTVTRGVEVFFYTFEGYENYYMNEIVSQLNLTKTALLPIYDFERNFGNFSQPDDKGFEKIIPYITNISKGEETNYVKEHFESIVSHCRDTGIYIGNLSWIRAFREAGIPVYGDYGLNVYNRFSAHAYESIGVKRCIQSLETLGNGYGNFPLIISEHEPEGSVLIDRKKERLNIIKRDFSNQYIITSEDGKVNKDAIDNAISNGVEIIRIYV